MSDKDIVKIVKLKGIRVKSLHNNRIFMKRDIIRVDYRNGDKRFINTLAKRDMTDIPYFALVYPKKLKEKIIFQEDLGVE